MTDPREPDAHTQRQQGRPAAGKKALGKGLGALIGESRAALGRTGAAPTLQEGRLRELPLADISVNRRQPRRTFPDDELQELAASIKALGVVQPIVVRPLHEAPGTEAAPTPTGVRFELIAGERRLRAAKLAGLEYIPALVRPADEISSLEIALAENVAREDLNAIEEALAYAALADEFGLTHERIAELVGRSRVSVTNLLRLLDLPDDVQALIETGELTEGHGRALLGLPDHGERRRVARLVVSEGLTVRQVETLVRKLQEAPEEATTTSRPAAGPDYSDLVDELYGLFETPVKIRGGKRGGSIQIGFKDDAELRRLLELLRSLG
ncbi:MAG TPA: ParB/RepB/Spo0J family partition protein [Thermoleophilia bacterium]|nr:ParB/RepB/Spo0J family partition protein [Thermoleophilia bacterium]